MKYLALLLLVSLSFGQNSGQKPPEEIRLPNGKIWSDVIAEADHKKNIADARQLAELSTEVRDEIEAGDKFVLSLKTLKKIETVEKLAKDMRSRMRKN